MRTAQGGGARWGLLALVAGLSWVAWSQAGCRGEAVRDDSVAVEPQSDGDAAASPGEATSDAQEPARPACSAPALAAPAWFDDAVGYEIFVRSFADSDGDGVGDLRGLTGKLGYLRDVLGVDLLWLMPITESPSYHGYDTTD